MRGRVIAVLLLVCGGAQALPWSRDMVDQPSIKPQEARVVKPENTVPASGREKLAVPANVGEAVQARMAAGRTLNNPAPADAESVERGKQVYETHCLVCHGSGGKGDGAVGKKFVPPPMDLTTAYVQQQPDGQIYYTITHGGVAMPFYRDAIDEIDRWHLVNYMKQELKAE